MPTKKIAPKTAPFAKRIVIDEQGKKRVLHGFGWGENFPLDIDPRIDLTQPIWEQVQRLAAKDARRTSKKAAA